MEGIPHHRCLLGIKVLISTIRSAVLTTQPPGSSLTLLAPIQTPNLFITLFFSSPFVDLQLLIYAPDLYCQLIFPIVISFPLGFLQDSCISPFTFDFSFPTPFHLFPDFNFLLDEAPFVFDYSDFYVLTPSLTQDTLSATATILQIQLYNSSVTLAYDSHPSCRSPKARRPSRHSRIPLNDEDPFRPPNQQLSKHRTSHPRKRHEQHPHIFFNTNGQAWSL